MKKILFITTLTFLLYVQAKGQHVLPPDSLAIPKSEELISAKTSEDRKTEGRQSYTKTDSLGNRLVLTSPSNKFKLMIQYSDSLKNNGVSVKPSRYNSDQAYLLMGQMLTQEGLYRLSESFFNGAIDSASYKRLYSETLQYTIDLITEQIDLEDAKTEQIKAETERAKIEVEKLKLELEMLRIEKGMNVREQGTNVREQGTGNTKQEVEE